MQYNIKILELKNHFTQYYSNLSMKNNIQDMASHGSMTSNDAVLEYLHEPFTNVELDVDDHCLIFSFNSEIVFDCSHKLLM